ncbi:Glycosyltransferase, DXD sugar-binding motif [Dillenia turbinata]|uniref:Glycosyltransferase, DXD sugar-binding motif n=1 Tax=Dillenia turbinata TaxID=194707 RepID=A0AAN8UTX3_9MAGN
MFSKFKKPFLFLVPTSILAFLLLLCLAYNGFSVFCVVIPFPAKLPKEPSTFWPSSSSSSSSSLMFAVKEESAPSILKTQLKLLPQKSDFEVKSSSNSSTQFPRKMRKNRRLLKILKSKPSSRAFSARVKEFFNGSSLNCKIRFFMTWIASLNSFGERELFTIQSLFKSHPRGCLVLISNSMDSSEGFEILRPFSDLGFRVIAISPDFDFIFKNTLAESWFDKLKKGNVEPGEVSIGQNLSNLLRLVILYKFGGIYIDSDVIVLKSFRSLRNVIGAQTMDLESGNWSRLNNAVMVFDKKHPLLYKFIEEFALTFDGNKWGHNGPYLVSRVVARVSGRPGFNFTVLPPSAFYPVDWTKVPGFFHGPQYEFHSKWLLSKLQEVRERSFALHLWNRQSRKLKIEEGSIISHILKDNCVFCNSSVAANL